ncbi:Embryonic polarity protein dorsal, partial [Armadillidium nasatum]
VVNSKGPAMVIVSCVTVTEPYKPHPHNLVGKEGCEDGICSVLIDNAMMECSFSNLGIHNFMYISAGRTSIILVFCIFSGFRTSEKPSINRPKFNSTLFSSVSSRPKVRGSIPSAADRFRANLRQNACSSCVTGGKEIILLCDKIVKEDIKVRFFEMKENQVEWEAFGDFQSSDVHKQVAISFKTPRYKDLEVTQTVKVSLQLFRPSDKSVSETVPFEYYPINKDYDYVEDRILHITHPASKEVLTSDSPAESMQEVSDESDLTDYSSAGTTSKSVKRFKSSSSPSKKGSTSCRSIHWQKFGVMVSVFVKSQSLNIFVCGQLKTIIYSEPAPHAMNL